MTVSLFIYAVLGIATFPFIYYLISLYSAWGFFRRRPVPGPKSEFTPPVSNLKPLRGLDPEAYENFASFCRQDYPDYELLFCVGDKDDPVVPILEKLARDFPERRITVLFGTSGNAANDKVAKLARLVSESRKVTPLAKPKVGAVTCFYVPTEEKTLAESLQTIGMVSDFYAGILVARKLDGVKFALGPTIATTRTRLAGFGGYKAIENQPGDDLLVGRLIAEQGYEVELLPYTILTVADYGSMPDLLHKRMRWVVVMRHMRPWGHFGLVFTQGLFWSLAAIAVRPTAAVALGYLGAYLVLRLAMTWLIGVRGLGDRALWKKLWLIPVWDALAFFIWMFSFVRSSIRWRGGEYYIRDGQLVPVAANQTEK
jgi:ceramide glucosyltransferase